MKPSARWLDALPLLLALTIVARVLLTFVGRYDHPFDLEWMEGGMLAHAWRIQQGLGLYVAPNPDFIPYIYPPGYPSLLAALGSVFELEYPLGRILSIVGTVAAAAAIPFITSRQLGHTAAGFAGAGLFLGLYRASGGFYDLVRPDALGVALVAWSVAFALERWRGADIVSGLLLCVAFLFKHNFALFGLPILAGIWMRDGHRGAGRFVASSAGSALAAVGLIELWSGGHFLTYLLAVPRSHPMKWDRFWHGLPGELGIWLLPAVLVGAGWILWRTQSGRTRGEWLLVVIPSLLATAALLRLDPLSADSGAAWVGAVTAGALVSALGASIGFAARALTGRAQASWRAVLGVGVVGVALVLAGLMRAHHGGFINVLMPAHWALALALPVGLEDLRRRLGPGAVVIGAFVLLGHLGWVSHRLETDSVVPDDADVAAGRAVEHALAEHCPEGLIFAPQFAWLPTRVNRPPSMALIALWDVIDHRSGPYRATASKAMKEAVSEHHWACVLQGSGRHAAWRGLTKSYRLEEVLRPPANQLRPKTGWRVRPAEILVPRTSP